MQHINHSQVVLEVFQPVVHANIALPEFMEELCLRNPREFCGLTKRHRSARVKSSRGLQLYTFGGQFNLGSDAVW